MAKEPVANGYLAELLKNMSVSWEVISEQSKHTQGRKTPDILVITRDAGSVIIETEFAPGQDVESDAKKKCNEKLTDDGTQVSSVIALKIPKEIADKEGKDMREGLASAIFEYCVFFPKKSDTIRFPENGWLSGGIGDLALLIGQASVPRNAISTSVNAMTEGAKNTANIINKCHHNTKRKILNALKQGGMDKQTWGLAGLIIQNAMLFYDGISEHLDMKSTTYLSVWHRDEPDKILKEWKKITEEIDYVPIFSVAMNILGALPTTAAQSILENTYKVVGAIKKTRMSKSGDIYGTVFQKMVTDDKRLGTYYTLPESAALLASLILTEKSSPLWSDLNEIREYQVADFACGTGMLLSTIYRQIVAYCRIHKLDVGEIHDHMMEKNLIGFDVLPLATHMTVSSLAGLFPQSKFEDTRIHLMNLGKRPMPGSDVYEDVYDLGSFDLLSQISTFEKSGTKLTGGGASRSRVLGWPTVLAHVS